MSLDQMTEKGKAYALVGSPLRITPSQWDVIWNWHVKGVSAATPVRMVAPSRRRTAEQIEHDRQVEAEIRVRNRIRKRVARMGEARNPAKKRQRTEKEAAVDIRRARELHAMGIEPRYIAYRISRTVEWVKDVLDRKP